MAEWGDEWGELWGGAISLIQTHEVDAIARLKYHLSGQGNAESLVGIFAERWQITDNFLSDLLTLIDLDASFGDVQDKLGALLNVSRSGFLDEDYRRFLTAKALILIPKRRTTEGLLTLARALLGPKTLSSLEPFIFDPDMSTLVDRVTAFIGAATGTTYDADSDGRDFDGIDDLIDWASGTDLTGSGMTFSAIITPSAVAASQRIMSLQRADTFDSVFFQISPNGPGRLELRHTNDAGATLQRIGTTILANDVEHHVAVTYVGNNVAADVKIYIDGIEDTYATTIDGGGTERDVDGSWTLGSRDDGGNFFPGRIRLVKMWDRVLTPTEVQTLFQGGKRFIDYAESYPKSFLLTLEDITTDEEIIFREFLRVARPATYNGAVLIVPDPAFGYDDSTAVATTDVEGFDDSTGAVVAGGPYAHLLVL